MKTQAEKDQEAAMEAAEKHESEACEWLAHYSQKECDEYMFLAGIAYGRANPVVSEGDERSWTVVEGRNDGFFLVGPNGLKQGQHVVLKSALAHERAKLQKVREALEKIKKGEGHAAVEACMVIADHALALLDGKEE